MITVREITNTTRHGGPYDRGAADAYYGRAFNPHYFKAKTYQSEMVGIDDMKPDELLEYTRGYAGCADRKEW